MFFRKRNDAKPARIEDYIIKDLRERVNDLEQKLTTLAKLSSKRFSYEKKHVLEDIKEEVSETPTTSVG